MKDLLEDIWNSYLSQKTTEQSGEKRVLIDAILKAEDNLREGMNEEQIDLLEKYVDCIVGLHTVSEAEAFIKGIHFASSFFVEAFEMR